MLIYFGPDYTRIGSDRDIPESQICFGAHTSHKEHKPIKRTSTIQREGYAWWHCNMDCTVMWDACIGGTHGESKCGVRLGAAGQLEQPLLHHRHRSRPRRLLVFLHAVKLCALRRRTACGALGLVVASGAKTLGSTVLNARTRGTSCRWQNSETLSYI